MGAHADLKDSVIIVTGAGRGLGRAMVLGLVAVGARVAAVDRDAEPLQEVQASAAAQAGALVSFAVDLTMEGASDKLTAQVTDRFGPIDGLVNAAGIGQEIISAGFATKPVLSWEVSLDQWRAIFAVNAEATFCLCRAVLPGMLRRRFGRIVNVTTSLDTMIRQGMSPYGPSKAAIEAFSAILAKELEGTGVGVNVLVPGGPADTRMMAGVPRHLLIAPEVMVAPVRFLVSRGNNLNGQRVRAVDWDPDSPLAVAIGKAVAPAAWPGLVGGAARTSLASV